MGRLSLLACLIALLVAVVAEPASACAPAAQSLTQSGNGANLAPRVKLVYAHPANVGDRFATVHDTLRDAATAMGAAITARSGGNQTIRFELFRGIECGGSSSAWTPGIADVALPRRSWDYALAPTRLGSDLRAALGTNTSALADALVFVDGVAVSSAAAGDHPGDDTPGATNLANSGARVAVVPALGTSGWSGQSAAKVATLGLAALLPTLGVSRTPCPAADVLCPATPVPDVGTLGVDAAGTSYYSLGAGLAGHYDLVDSAFLCRTGHCADTTPQAPATSAPAVPLRYVWDIAGSGPQYGPTAPTGDTVTIVPQNADPIAVKVRVSSADGQWTQASLTVTATAPATTASTPTTTKPATTTLTATTTNAAHAVSTVATRAPAAITTAVSRAAFTREIRAHRLSVDASTSRLAAEVDDDAYSWDFGDGTTATGPLATHVYAEDGRYDVTLTIDVAGVEVTRTVTTTIGSGVSTGCATTSTRARSPLSIGTTPRRQAAAVAQQGLVVTGTTRHAPLAAPLKFAVFAGRKRIAQRNVACPLADGGGFAVRIPITTALKPGDKLTVAVVNPRLHAGSGIRIRVS